MSDKRTGFSPVTTIVLMLVSAVLLSGCIGESSPFDPSDSPGGSEAPPPVSAEGFWDTPFALATSSAPANSDPAVTGLNLEIADNGDVFLSYANTSSAGDENMKVLRAAAPDYAWSSPDNAMMTPVDINNSAASMTRFAVNKSNADGYALWNDGNSLQISEFMNAMGHFMTRASAGDGHAPQLLTNDAAQAFLVTQSHMTNGFGLDVLRRTGVGQWAGPVQLHRMGMDAANEILMPEHFLKAVIDGQGDILAVWLEQQGDEYRLMSATYNTSGNSWGTVTTIVDSGNTHGLDLAAAKSIGIATEPGTANAHVALFTNDGADKAVFTIDYDGAWQMPMRADGQTATSTISGPASYAAAAGHLVAVWVETEGAMQTIKALRLDVATGWSSVTDVAMAMDTDIENPVLALNSAGDAIAAWVETGAEGTSVQASLQKPGGNWAAKELVQAVADGDMVYGPTVAMHSDGTPWIVTTTASDDGDNMSFSTNLIRRAANIDDVSDGSDDGGASGPDAGAGDGHDHDHGDDGGTTDPGTGGAGSGDVPGVEPGTDFVSGYWHASSMVASATQPNNANPAIVSRRLEVTNDDDVFLSWSSQAAGAESFNLMRATEDSAGAYTWSDPANSLFVPLGISDTSTMIRFTANKVNGDGYALWSDGEVLKISEFMGGMSHFMNTTEAGEGHEPKILVDSTGKAYLFKQSHMMNGFGLDVSSRIAMGNWSSPAQLHRMGMDAANAIAMPDHFLTGVIDGQDNVAAVWLETQAGVTRLNSATYNAGSNTWGAPTTILDSNDSHGIDLASLASMALVGEDTTANLHLVIFEDTGDSGTIHSIDFVEGTWNEPVRRDMDMGGMAMIVGEPQYASNQDGHLLAVWVESHMGETHIQSLRFNTNTWNAVEAAAMPAAEATIENLGVDVNHHGDALVTWTENDASGLRILAALQMAGASWAHKELVEEAVTGTTVSNLVGTLSHTGMPWVAWTMGMNMESNTMLMSHVSMRHASIESTTPPDSGTGDGSTDPGAGGGTTDPGTGDGTTDPGTGDGTTDPGAGGGTTDPGTGGGTTDPGTGGGTTDPTIGAVTGLWESGTGVATTEMPTTSEAATSAPAVQAANNGNLFATWLTNSGHAGDAAAHSEQDITIMRGVPASSGGYTWSDPASAMMKPFGYDAHAEGTRFVVNPVTGDGFASWRDETTTYVSEFMGMMGHFMTNVAFPASDNAQVVVDASGQVYLLMKTPMMGGFGLSVYTRSAFDTWSEAVQLHRMDMTNAFTMLNDFMISTVDGMNNIRVFWLEEQAGTVTLQTATFNTASSTWGTVSDVHAHGLTLNKIVSGIANGAPGSDALQLVLHQQDGAERAIFALGYTQADGWGEPMQLDMASSDINVVAAPAFARNANGALLVGWIETNAGMSANNSDGLMHMIATRQYTSGGGWSAMDHVAHAAMTADASSLGVALGASGDATAAWLESSNAGANLFASHKIAANDAWSQKELVSGLSDGDGAVQALTVGLNGSNTPLVLLATRNTDGVNDMLQMTRIMRLTAINDAQTGGGSTDPGAGGGTTDPGTGGGTTDPGTGGGDSGNPPLATVNWTTPELVSQMSHSTSATWFFGPEIVKDDLDGTMVKMSMADLNTGGNGNAVASVHNSIVRSLNGGDWQELLMGSGLLDDLSPSALVQTIRVVPATGNLYGLISDGNTLYLARYLADVGWSKLEIPDVSTRILRRNLQLTSNNTGMVTITWHEPSAECCTVDINAKHFMVAEGWQETETLKVAAQSIVSPHVVDHDGKVHAAWLVDNADPAVGGYDMKMATYTPMIGWSEDMEGPTGLCNSVTKTSSGGENQIVVAADLVSNEISAYIVKTDGTWADFFNINQKADGDGVQLVDYRDIQVISGASGNFMVVWREHVEHADGTTEVRYMTASTHQMASPDTGMMMWHWGDPSQVGGINTEAESHLNFAMDSMGTAYAVWISVDQDNGLSHVYVNRAAMMSGWESTPEMLAEYDIDSGNAARNTSIAINARDEVGISWDQHVVTNTTSMHNVWVVENK
jgi:hypothetical protein